MIGKKVTYKYGEICERKKLYRGTILDKVLVPKKVYEHKPTVMHSSYNPEYKETVNVNAYLIQEEELKKVHTVLPEDIERIET